MSEHKFKVGERVRCVKEVCLLALGAEYEVVGIKGGGSRVVVRGPNYPDPVDFMVSRFEPLPSPSQPASQWVEVDRNETHVLLRMGQSEIVVSHREAAAGPDATWPTSYERGTFLLGKRAFRWLKGWHAGQDAYGSSAPMASTSTVCAAVVTSMCRSLQSGSVVAGTGRQPGSL